MKKILLFLIFLFFGANIALAEQNPQITFPIAELGNCNNVQTCKVYCDQRENKDACIAFAKSQGLYKQTVSEQKVNALSVAKAELGCSSVESCKTLCQQKANQAKCQAFGQKHKLSTSQPEDEKLLIKAKQNLNCDSFEGCKALCDKQENYTKCAALLQDQVTSDDRAMFEKYKPQIKEFLGCDSMVTCMAFCINPTNSAKCAELGSKIGGSQTPNQEPPEIWCPKISSECRWDGSNCFCEGPQSCSQNSGCSWNGQYCNCGDTPETFSESPEVWCPKAGSGCSWDGKQCTCFEGGSPTQTDIPPPAQEPGEVWCPKIGPYCTWDGANCTCWDDCVKSGGKWTGSKCEYQGGEIYTQQDEKTVEQSQPSQKELERQACETDKVCKWDGNYCVCPNQQSVQGVKTNRGLIEQLLDFLLTL